MAVLQPARSSEVRRRPGGGRLAAVAQHVAGSTKAPKEWQWRGEPPSYKGIAQLTEPAVRLELADGIVRLSLWYARRRMLEGSVDADFAEALEVRTACPGLGGEGGAALRDMCALFERRRADADGGRALEDEGRALLWPAVEARSEQLGPATAAPDHDVRPYEAWSYDYDIIVPFEGDQLNIHIVRTPPLPVAATSLCLTEGRTDSRRAGQHLHATVAAVGEAAGVCRRAAADAAGLAEAAARHHGGGMRLLALFRAHLPVPVPRRVGRQRRAAAGAPARAEGRPDHRREWMVGPVHLAHRRLPRAQRPRVSAHRRLPVPADGLPLPHWRDHRAPAGAIPGGGGAQPGAPGGWCLAASGRWVRGTVCTKGMKSVCTGSGFSSSLSDSCQTAPWSSLT